MEIWCLPADAPASAQFLATASIPEGFRTRGLAFSDDGQLYAVVSQALGPYVVAAGGVLPKARVCILACDPRPSVPPASAPAPAVQSPGPADVSARPSGAVATTGDAALLCLQRLDELGRKFDAMNATLSTRLDRVEGALAQLLANGAAARAAPAVSAAVPPTSSQAANK